MAWPRGQGLILTPHGRWCVCEHGLCWHLPTTADPDIQTGSQCCQCLPEKVRVKKPQPAPSQMVLIPEKILFCTMLLKTSLILPFYFFFPASL